MSVPREIKETESFLGSKMVGLGVLGSILLWVLGLTSGIVLAEGVDGSGFGMRGSGVGEDLINV